MKVGADYTHQYLFIKSKEQLIDVIEFPIEVGVDVIRRGKYFEESGTENLSSNIVKMNLGAYLRLPSLKSGDEHLYCLIKN